MDKKILFSVLASILLASQAAALDATLVANSIDLALAEDYLASLQEDDLSVDVVSAEEFAGMKNSETVFLLGGHRAPEGIGDLVGSLLSEDDKSYLLSSREARKAFVFHDVWAKDQTVVVFAGYEKEQTRQIMGETRTDLVDFISSGAQGELLLSFPPLDFSKNFTDVDVYQADAIMQSLDVVVVDVRSPPYFEAGRLPEAVNLPEEEALDRWGELDPEQTYLLYCGGNSQSIRVGNILAGKGFSRLYRMVDGYAAWRRAGYVREE